nr:MAG TPA: hypothetical protein [Caudoviricetes sp.]
MRQNDYSVNIFKACLKAFKTALNRLFIGIIQ